MEQNKPQATWTWEELRRVREQLQVGRDSVPEGVGFTMRQYAAAFGLSEPRAKKELGRLLQAGAVRAVGFRAERRPDGRGGVSVKVFIFVREEHDGAGHRS